MQIFENQNILKIFENMQISAMGASSEVILFTNVGEVEGSLAYNNDLTVDAKKAVVQHPTWGKELLRSLDSYPPTTCVVTNYFTNKSI